MRIDDSALLQRVLTMFRRGYDTMAISDEIEIRESTVERLLHTALAWDRESKKILHDERGHA
jgi:hypothetical protein